MRIGIDARELCGRPTGVGRYLLGLLAQWSNDAGQSRRHEFVLYVPSGLTVALDSRRFATRLVPGPPGTWWEQVRLPRAVSRDHVNAFFAPAYSAPLTWSVPTVVAIHDISFVAHPEWFTMREGIRRRWLTRQVADRADAIITISEFTRRELVEQLRVPDSRIHVVPPGVMASGVTRSSPSDPRVLFVGSVFNRRHVPDLIRAFALVAARHPDVSLDLVGDNRTFPRQDINHVIDGERLGGRVRWHKYVSDEALRALYAEARAFAFLSEYEGLGLTPLEALASGIPPVLLDTAVARESCADAALYVGLGDSIATARALEQALFDDEARGRMLAAAPQVLSRYAWPRAARDTLAVIESVVRGDAHG